MNDRWLRMAGALFAIGTAVHIADHLRRGQGSVSDQINAAGTVGLVLQVVVITLIAVRDPRAPRVATLGFPLAIGFGVVHWIPGLGALGDPISELTEARGVTATASLLEIAGALIVGVAGLRALRNTRNQPTANGHRFVDAGARPPSL